MAGNFNLQAVISAVDKLSPVLKNIQHASRATRKAVKDIGSAWRDLQTSLGGIVNPLTAVIGAGGVAGIAGFVGKVVQTSAEFEKFQTILETVEGSSQKAKQSMAWVSDFATKTPYELNDVTGAFVKLKAYGIDPQTGALRAAGDAAAAMGKPLESAVEALADAMTGENERLKEFGITANKTGGKIVYQWVQNGKQMAAKVDANNKAMIQSTIQGIWNSRYGGAMDKLSGTWDGLMSNIKDTVSRFFLAIGDAGVFDFLKGELSGLLNLFNRMAADGSLKALATQISQGLVSAFKDLKAWAMSVDWKGVWSDIQAVAHGIGSVVSALGGIKGVAIIFGVAMAAGIIAPIVQIGVSLYALTATLSTIAMPAILMFGKVLGGLGWVLKLLGGAILKDVLVAFRALAAVVMANPIIAAVAAIALAAYLIYDNWGTLKTWFAGLWEGVKGVFSAGFDFVKAMFLDFSPLGLIIKNWSPIVEWFKGMWETVKGYIEPILSFVGIGGVEKGGAAAPASPVAAASGGGVKPASLPAQQAAANSGRAQLNGAMTVRFENAPPGLRASPGRTNQAGVSLNPDVGYAGSSMPAMP